MKKKFIIVFIAVLCFLGFVTGCGSSSEADEVLAIGMKENPTVVNYEVGMPLDIAGAKVAVVYDNEPTEVVVFDLTKDMVNENSYDIHVPGTKNVEVVYEFGGKKYSTSFVVEYAEKGFKTKAINDINAYKTGTVYSANGREVVEAVKSLAVVNVKLSNTESEVAAVVAKAKQKIDAVPSKAQEDAANKPSASLLNSKANAIKEIENYCLKDKNGNVIKYPDLYAQIISASRVIGKADVNAATNVEEVQIALITAKANIDNAVLGNKTLDEINSSKVAADAAASVATSQAQKAKEAQEAAKDAADEAKDAKADAVKAQGKAEEAKAAAEKAQKAAEAAKKAAEDIKKDVNATQVEINKAKAAAEKAQKAAEAAEDAAEKAQKAAETAQAKAEAAQAAAELAQSKAETAQAKAEAAQAAAEEAKKAAADILEEIKGIYNQIPEAAPAIAEVNGYVQDDNYAGIYKLLVQNTKTSYVAAIKMAKTKAEVDELVAGAKAALDQIADKTSTGAAADAEAALELDAAKASAKAQFSAYVDILEFQKPAGAPFPGEVDEYPENPDQQKLLDVINALITETEAEIDAATSVEAVELALAKGMGQAKLETIYVDYYSSWLVQELGILFRSEYQPYQLSYSKENYDKLLQIMDFYVTYIGRIDKIDELNAKFEQAKEELEDVKTQSEEVAEMIFAVTLPILIEVYDGDFDSKRDELNAIETKLVDFGVRNGTNLRCIDELENYPDPQDPTNTINMIALFDKYLARYAELEAAEADANVAATGVIAIIEALPAKALINYNNKAGYEFYDHENAVIAARAAYDLWIDTYFTNAATGSYDHTEVKEALNTRLVKNYDKLLEAEARIAQLKEAADKAPAIDTLIDSIIDPTVGYVTINPNYNDEAEFFAAEQAYCDWLAQYEITDMEAGSYTINALNVTKRVLLAEIKERLDVLNQAKAAAEAAGGTIELIDAIIDEAAGEYITLYPANNDVAEFLAAEQSYTDWMTQYNINESVEPLNADIVTNRADLATYKARLDVLQQAQAAAPAVDALIDTVIPTGAVTLDDLAALEAAEAAYENWLTTYVIDPVAEPLNADLVEGRQDLADYREKYDYLVLLAKEVDEAIDGIGEIDFNSEAAIEKAENLYQNLVVENNNVPSEAHIDYADLLKARAEFEALLYGEARAIAYTEVSDLITSIIDQMGPSRHIDERQAVKSVGNAALVAINDIVPAPVAPSPYVFGAWTSERTAYQASFDQLVDKAYADLYKTAIYLVYGNAVDGYDVHIYNAGTYSKFITKQDGSIKAVKDLYIDALVGTGHVELTGLSISGTVYVNGGGSSSVVFTDCAVGNIEINYEGVRVVFNEDAHVNGVVAAGNKLEKTNNVIIQLNNAEVKEIEVYCNVKFEGSKKADTATNIAVKGEVALDAPNTILGNSTFVKDETVEEYSINGSTVDSEIVEVAGNGAITVSAPAIALDDNQTTGNLEYVIDGTSIVFGGEGQKLAYNNGYKLGVKFTAPALVVNYSNLTVKVNGELVEVEVLEGGYFNYVFEVKEVPTELTIVVAWMENMNELSYNVSVAEGTTLDITSGEFTEDEGKIAGPEAIVVAEGTEITVDGVLKYYAENELQEGAAAGYYVGYNLIPDPATGADVESEAIIVTPEVIANGYSFKRSYGEASQEFVYTIKFAETVKFETETAVEKYGEDYAETVVVVEDKVINVSGKVPYILADESLGRAAGYRVGLAISQVKGIIAGTAKLVKVDGSEIELAAELAANDNVLYYFVPVVPGTKEYTFEVKWNEYAEEAKYTIVIADDAEFEVPAAEEVKIEGKEAAKVGEVIDFKAQVLPIYAEQKVEWSVTDETVAEITEAGKLTALFPGKVVVKAAVNEVVYAEIEVVVTDYTIAEIVAMTPKTTNAADKVAVGFDGVIVALQYKGYWVADETGLVLIYTNSTTYPTVGKYVYVNGKVTTYQPNAKFTCQISDSSYTVLEGEAPKYDLTAVEYQLAESYAKGIDTLEKATESGYYGKVLKVKGTISGSGNYWYISDAEGHRFYISSAYTTKDLKAGYEAELDLLVREVYFKKDTSTYNNYDACTLGGFYLGTPVVYANEITVDATVEAGYKNVVNGLTYAEGVNVFATIQGALDAAKAGEEIVVKAGTYAEEITISKEVTLVGPNAGVAGTEERAEEAVIDGITNVNAKATLDGIKFTKAIKVGANEVTITNSVVTPTNTVTCNGNNRQGCIVDSADISDLTISNNYIDAPGTSNSYVYQFISLSNVTNLTITGNYITNSQQATVSSSFEGMILYYAYGTLEISNNEFAWGTDGYIFNLGYYGNYCTDVNIVDNVFSNNGIIKQNATIWFRRLQNAEANINIIGNTFIEFKGTTISVNGSGKAPVINVKYNYFDAGSSYKVGSGTGYPTFVYENNYYATEQKTATSDYGVITSLDGLKEAYAAYKKSLEPQEIKYDFVANFGTYAAKWGSSYTKLTVTNENLGVAQKATFVLSNANKQPVGNSIDDRPVLASKSSAKQYVTVSGWEGELSSVAFELKQWTSSKKFKNLVIEYTTDGSTWTAACDDLFNGKATAITDGLVVSADIPEGAVSVRLAFLGSTTSNNQVGLTSVTLVIK